MDIKSLLINTLSDFFDYPIILQGSMSQEEVYPDSFFTFFNNSSSSYAFYDNDESQIIWDFDLNFYSNDPELVNSVLLQAKSLLKAQNFIIDGAGYDVISDEDTHTGRGINVIYIEKVR